MSNLITFAATWFGLGRLKPAPGTWGTLGAIPLVLLFHTFGPYGYLGASLVLAGLAIFVAQLYQRESAKDDPSEVVIDEVAGFVVTMAWVPLTWQSWLIGFALFRALDVLKPPPIGWADRRIPGGVGVVADDLLAGILANVVLQILYTKTNWLGVQLLS